MQIYFHLNIFIHKYKMNKYTDCPITLFFIKPYLCRQSVIFFRINENLSILSLNIKCFIYNSRIAFLIAAIVL